MEEKLNEINQIFESGKHKETITSIEKLIEESPGDPSLHRAYDLLGKYLNFMGQHLQAVETWEKGLKLLESNIEHINELDESKLICWLNISLETARAAHRLGIDGPGVSYKNNHVCYTPSKLTKSEEAEWKTEKLQMAVRHFEGVLENIPAGNTDLKREIKFDLAKALFNLKQYDEAVKIYEDGFSDDGEPQWLYKAAECLWEQDKKELAYARLQQLIGTDASFASAYQMLATYFTEKGNTASAEEAMRKYKFYSWVPSFCHHIDYSEECLTMIEKLQSDESWECLNTILMTDGSRRATEFLAAICYHHYHGRVENQAFQELEKRGIAAEGAERDFIGSILMHLLKNHQSVCTVKGTADALAGMKHEELFKVLEHLLPRDINLCFPMNIPTALGKLGDPRAIVLLENIIKSSMTEDSDDDNDSSDGIFSSGGRNRLVIESCLALGSFIDDERAKAILINGINNQQTHEACVAVLFIYTNEQQYFEQLEKILIEGERLNYMVEAYLRNHAKKSPAVDKLLAINDEVETKKRTENSDEA